MFEESAERRFVAGLLDVLGLPLNARLLDCPCGQGRHARLLAEAGMRVTGVDYSRFLLRMARDAAPGAGGVKYVRADMRALPARWTGSFDAVLNLSSSFGFFLDPADDRKVVAEFARAIRTGGVLLWQGVNRDVVATRFPPRDWWTASGAVHVAQEREFDPLSGVLTVSTAWHTERATERRQHRIRLYNATHLSEIFAASGLIVETALDGDNFAPLSRGSSTMLLLARKEHRA